MWWPFWRRAPDDHAAAGGGPRVLAATFGRLGWLFPATGRQRVVHEGAGKYYGLAPAAGPERATERVFVVSRPDQERDDTLLEVDTLHSRGRVVRSVQLASRDTHQMVRDGERLFVTDTWRGNVLEYALPEVRLVRTLGGFTHESHVNSLLVEGESLYVLCHNKGKSFMARVALGSGEVEETWPDVGEHAHDIVAWGEGFLVCDSRGGGLLHVDRRTRACTTLYADPGHFTKGLVVDGGVAYFGISPAARREERGRVECELACFDLGAGRLLARRPIETRGLVNALATPASLAAQRGARAEPAAVSGVREGGRGSPSGRASGRRGSPRRE